MTSTSSSTPLPELLPLPDKIPTPPITASGQDPAAAAGIDEYLGIEYPDRRYASTGSRTISSRYVAVERQSSGDNMHVQSNIFSRLHAASPKAAHRSVSANQELQQPIHVRTKRAIDSVPRRPAGPTTQSLMQSNPSAQRKQRQQTSTSKSTKPAQKQQKQKHAVSYQPVVMTPDMQSLLRQRDELVLRSQHLQHLLQEASEIIAKQGKEIHVLRRAVTEAKTNVDKNANNVKLSEIESDAEKQQASITASSAAGNAGSFIRESNVESAQPKTNDVEAHRAVSDLLVTVANLRSELTHARERHAMEVHAFRSSSVRCMACGAWVQVGNGTIAVSSPSLSPVAGMATLPMEMTGGPLASSPSPNASMTIHSTGAPSLTSVTISPVRSTHASKNNVQRSQSILPASDTLAQSQSRKASQSQQRLSQSQTNATTLDDIVEVEMPSMIVSRLARRTSNGALATSSAHMMSSVMVNAGSTTTTPTISKITHREEPRVADVDEFEYIDDDDDDLRHDAAASDQKPHQSKTQNTHRNQNHMLYADTSAYGFGDDSITSSAIGSLLDETGILDPVNAGTNRPTSPLYLHRVYRSASKELIVAAAPNESNRHDSKETGRDNHYAIGSRNTTFKTSDKKMHAKVLDRMVPPSESNPRWTLSTTKTTSYATHATTDRVDKPFEATRTYQTKIAGTNMQSKQSTVMDKQESPRRVLPLPEPLSTQSWTSPTRVPSVSFSRSFGAQDSTTSASNTPSPTRPSQPTTSQATSLMHLPSHMQAPVSMSVLSLSHMPILPTTSSPTLSPTSRYQMISPDPTSTIIMVRERDALEQELLHQYTQMRSLEHTFEQEIASRDEHVASLTRMIEKLRIRQEQINERQKIDVKREVGNGDVMHQNGGGGENDAHSTGSGDSVIVHHFSFAQENGQNAID